MELSRRNFLKGGALSAAGLTLAGLAGCAPAEPTAPVASGDEEAAMAQTGSGMFDSGIETELSLADAAHEVDVVIIGGGAAGMAAAAEAGEQGLNALLVEATAAVGGTTQFAEGIAGVGTPIQQKLGVKNSVQELVDAEMVFSNYCAEAGLIRSYLEEADANIAWLQDLGVEFFEDVIGGTTQHMYVGQGRAMIEVLDDYVKEKGVQILTNTKAKRLFMDGGKVTGLLCEDSQGADVIIRADAVVMACGGYIQNDEMVDALQRFSHDRVKITANAGHDGAHMNMAYSAGADRSGITLMHFIWCALDSFDLHSELSTAACNEGYFWVNHLGERFCDESLTRNPSCIDNIVLNQKRAFAVLPDTEAKRLATEGCTVGWGSYIFAGSKMENLEAELAEAKQAAPEGFFYGETLDELASALEVSADTLKKTVSNYNAMVAAGADTDFGKQAPFLHEVSESGPFYAFELKCSAFCTMGGIRVNRENEVLDVNFEPIAGLYCAGVDCSGLQGTTYCMGIAGGAQGYAVYSGRNAVRNAKNYLGK